MFELRKDRGQPHDAFEALAELAHDARAVGFDHLEMRLRQAGQIDERNLAGLGGIMRAALIVAPTLGISAALREAGIDAFFHLDPFGVVHDFGADLDLLPRVVEGERGDFAGGDRAMHGAQIAARLAARRTRDLARPFFVERLRRCVIANLAGAVLAFGSGDAIDEPPRCIDLGDRDEQVEGHGCSLVRNGCHGSGQTKTAGARRGGGEDDSD